jgi:hypothetical protein
MPQHYLISGRLAWTILISLTTTVVLLLAEGTMKYHGMVLTRDRLLQAYSQTDFASARQNGTPRINIRPVKITTSYTPRWSLHDDADWESLVPRGGGFVKFDDSEEIYSVSLYHQVRNQPLGFFLSDSGLMFR